jgi:hypothetical protein
MSSSGENDRGLMILSNSSNSYGPSDTIHNHAKFLPIRWKIVTIQHSNIRLRAVLKQIVLPTMLSFSKRVDLNNGMSEDDR